MRVHFYRGFQMIESVSMKYKWWVHVSGSLKSIVDIQPKHVWRHSVCPDVNV